MKKFIKGLSILGGVGLSAVALASCGAEGGNEKPHLVVAVTQDTGTTFQSIKTWMDAAQTELNFTWEYVLASSRSSADNLTTLQNALMKGANGIISMVDIDGPNLTKLLSDLESYDAYYAGFETELANAKNANLLDNKRIIGTVTDGEGGASRGTTLFDEVVKTDCRKIVFAQYPESYFPNVSGAVEAFIAKAEEYNNNHEDDFTWYTSNDATYINNGTTLKFNFGEQLKPATYTAWEQAGVDAIVSVNSCAKLILPQTTGKENPIKLFSVGFDDETKDQLGGKALKTLSQTPAETIFYPVVQMLNTLRGKSYADAPKTAAEKVVTGHYVYLTSQADLTKASSLIMNFSSGHSLDSCLLKPAEAKKLLAGEEGATHAKLVEILDSWTNSQLLQ